MLLPTYFISHGGGPWPWMDEMRAPMAGLTRSLQSIAAELGRPPAAVLMVSAHWEAAAFTLMNGARPPMLYDYFGFPPHTYTIRYPAPGAPVLAERVHRLIEAAGLPAGLDAERGFDHGAFVPLAVMYPQADVPVLQLSLRAGLDPAEHLALGRALAPLRGEQVLILGSGLSYHNLRAFGPPGRDASGVWVSVRLAFRGDLRPACDGEGLDPRLPNIERCRVDLHLEEIAAGVGRADLVAAVVDLHRAERPAVVAGHLRGGLLERQGRGPGHAIVVIGQRRARRQGGENGEGGKNRFHGSISIAAVFHCFDFPRPG